MNHIRFMSDWRGDHIFGRRGWVPITPHFMYQFNLIADQSQIKLKSIKHFIGEHNFHIHYKNYKKN